MSPYIKTTAAGDIQGLTRDRARSRSRPTQENDDSHADNRHQGDRGLTGLPIRFR
jgi:hypothetical protein